MQTAKFYRVHGLKNLGSEGMRTLIFFGEFFSSYFLSDQDFLQWTLFLQLKIFGKMDMIL